MQERAHACLALSALHAWLKLWNNLFKINLIRTLCNKTKPKMGFYRLCKCEFVTLRTSLCEYVGTQPYKAMKLPSAISLQQSVGLPFWWTSVACYFWVTKAVLKSLRSSFRSTGAAGRFLWNQKTYCVPDPLLSEHDASTSLLRRTLIWFWSAAHWLCWHLD